jgi:hypothetical protein
MADMSLVNDSFEINELPLEEFLLRLENVRNELKNLGLPVMTPVMNCSEEAFLEFYEKNIKCTAPIKGIVRPYGFGADLEVRKTGEIRMRYSFIPDCKAGGRLYLNENQLHKHKPMLELQLVKQYEAKISAPKNIKITCGLPGRITAECDDKEAWNRYIEDLVKDIETSFPKFSDDTHLEVKFDFPIDDTRKYMYGGAMCPSSQIG